MKLLKWFLLSLTALTLLSAAPPQKAPKPAGAGKHAAKSSKLDINTATEADLRKLPGISEADAAKIVQNRPYFAKNELKKKKIIPAAAYEQIKTQVVAKPDRIPKK
jgi:competence protein ComEA